MTDQQQHPTIVLSPDLMRQWRQQTPRYCNSDAGREERLMERAAQWVYEQCGKVNEAQLQKARDEELEACCEWLRHEYGYGEELALRLRAAFRPKPPSLKALEIAERHGNRFMAANIRAELRKIDAEPTTTTKTPWLTPHAN